MSFLRMFDLLQAYYNRQSGLIPYIAKLLLTLNLVHNLFYCMSLYRRRFADYSDKR